MIRTILMLSFWAVMLPITVILCFPWTAITGDVRFLYHMGMWVSFNGVRIAGVRVKPVGLEKIDISRTYIFMSNHVSNIDPPLTLPLIPRRTSVMARHGLFKYPLLGWTMRQGDLVPVERESGKGGLSAIRSAVEVLRKGLNLTIYVEGGRSFDGKLLRFKKGPFYLAEECQVPVVPITIVGTHYVMPKGRFSMKAGEVQIIFHDPIEPKDFGDRELLMKKVRAALNSSLPAEMQEQPA
ncbi:MAG TPA: lysophospholipid acyltransferase family protein [Terriglobales bacterium]